MKRNSLGWWLAGINVLIVLVVAAGVSWVAIGLLQRLADGQQRVRVQLAAADARAELARLGEDTLSNARILAERPTLRRLLQQRDLTNLPPVLQQCLAQVGGQVDALDVLANAASGQAVHLLAHDADPARQFDVLTQLTQALATDLAGGGQRIHALQRSRQGGGHLAAQLTQQRVTVDGFEGSDGFALRRDRR